ncbi:putative bifunctional diguanylate cyclase/phosphodiesterase [Paenibacillus caui]|uniref:putative bifunctional diguanylate cyclase/phosphodiesterase n=1 Tax=Paenibacillus caui TaxID=2873927 RepID=UPI001CA98792|nr:bifunctional diguanylate cyclase/phosphodiesterase [Paenibacillus caui]
MRFRKERKSALRAQCTKALILVILGFCALFFIEALRSGSRVEQIEYLCLLLACCYMCGRFYRLDCSDAPHKRPFTKVQDQEHVKTTDEHDALTNLPNRTRFEIRLRERLNHAKPLGLAVGVLMIHVNCYKTLNGILGYEAGDRLLQMIGKRIAGRCESSEEMFRIGVDDYSIILGEYASPDDMHQRAENLLSGLNLSAMLGEAEYYISLSQGIALYPADGETAEQLARNAELAVYYAKEHGIDVYRYSNFIKTRTLSRLELENDMRKGLERQEFFLEYQPQVHLDSGKMVGLEALVRWAHPKRGLMSPAEFIPIAEDCGFIVQLGEWVLRTACRQNKLWQEEGFEPVSISVNLSMRQFRDFRFVELVADVLTETGMDAKYLELEITESMTIDKKSAFEQLQGLKQLGIFISIDDFGTGYSSLHYLKNLPIDRIKIDRSFLQEVVADGSDAAIISTIAAMAHHLKLKVTAEGVENTDQLEFLKLQNCHEGQGYLFSRPVPAKELKRDFLVKVAV